MTRSRAEFEIVMDLVRLGYNDCEVARRTGVPRPTVRDWRCGHSRNTLRSPHVANGYRCSGGHDFSGLPVEQYSYLLGMYLGDGYINETNRGVFRLRVSMDAKYPDIADETSVAMEALMPGQQVHRVYRRKARCLEVSMYSKHWPCLFPQHGPGRKHSRSIRLEASQEELLDDELMERFVGPKT